MNLLCFLFFPLVRFVVSHLTLVFELIRLVLTQSRCRNTYMRRSKTNRNVLRRLLDSDTQETQRGCLRWCLFDRVAVRCSIDHDTMLMRRPHVGPILPGKRVRATANPGSQYTSHSGITLRMWCMWTMQAIHDPCAAPTNCI